MNVVIGILFMFIKIDILVFQSYTSYIVCKDEELFCPNFSIRHICKFWRVVLALVNNLVWCFFNVYFNYNWLLFTRWIDLNILKYDLQNVFVTTRISLHYTNSSWSCRLSISSLKNATSHTIHISSKTHEVN